MGKVHDIKDKMVTFKAFSASFYRSGGKMLVLRFEEMVTPMRALLNFA